MDRYEWKAWNLKPTILIGISLLTPTPPLFLLPFHSLSFQMQWHKIETVNKARKIQRENEWVFTSYSDVSYQAFLFALTPFHHINEYTGYTLGVFFYLVPELKTCTEKGTTVGFELIMVHLSSSESTWNCDVGGFVGNQLQKLKVKPHIWYWSPFLVSNWICPISSFW